MMISKFNYMAKKLNSMPDYTARMPKQPHDVSQSTAFTACPGMLLPVYFDMLHHGDEIHFSASEFVRMNPLVTQALGQIDVHLDFFFVPLTVMYTPASSLFYQTDDLVSSLVDRESLKKDGFPVWKMNSFIEGIASAPDQSAPFTDSAQLDNQFFDCRGKSVFRMMDLLDLNPLNFFRYVVQDYSHPWPNFTPWFPAAYQAIYQLYYRNDDREPKNYIYNFDKYYDGIITGFSDGDAQSLKLGFLDIHYCSRPKDYFNAVKVSPIGSSVSMLSQVNQTLFSVNKWINSNNSFTGVSASQSWPNVLDDSEITSIQGANAGSNRPFLGAGYLNAANIRQLFMVDKLLRVIGRTEKNYESQFLAHYGIKVPHDVMHNITHIGHDMATLTPDAVISQSDTFNGTTGSALGEIGGQGSVMLRGKKRDFKAPFHGVFMVIAHIVPRMRYVAGLNKLHQLNSPSDFWQPEFDKKGMQPLFRYETMSNSDDVTRFGWQFAYEQFKRKYDRTTTAFMPVTTSDLDGSVNRYAPWVMNKMPYGVYTNDGRLDAPDSVDSSYLAQMLLVSPNDLNGIMIVPHSTQWIPTAGTIEDPHFYPWLIYQTDPFICDFNLYCKKVNGMSEYGEPEL